MTCPSCQSSDIIPITYGPPPLTGARLDKALAEKTIVLGGCPMCGPAPKWYCRTCGARFDAKKPKKGWFWK